MAGEFSPGAAGGGINFTYITQKIGNVLQSAETSLRSQIEGMSDSPTQQELVEMQIGMQKWTMLIQLQSTINKEMGDALKGVIQKSA